MPYVETKRAFKSKLNWLGVLTALAGAGMYADIIPQKYAPVLLGVAGLATAILRTWFTKKPIDSIGG